jgi:hypothetical protein
MGGLLSLSKSATSVALDLSEYALLFFGLVLVVGIFGEYKKVPKRFLKWPKELFEILVMVGVAGELLADGGVFVFSHRLQILEGADIQTLDLKAEKAGSKATDALNRSETSLSQAGAASDAAKAAVDKSDKAGRTATNAMRLATGARKEADSFERDIISAKEQAAEAQSHLGEALRRAIEATAALNRIKSPRSLIHIPELVATLEAFKDTEYTFSSVFQDEESIDLLKQLDTVLQRAGWKRVKPPPGSHFVVNVYLGSGAFWPRLGFEKPCGRWFDAVFGTAGYPN